MKKNLKKILVTFCLFVNFKNNVLSKAIKRNPDNHTYYLRGKYHDIIFKGYLYKEANKLMNKLEHFLPYNFIDIDINIPRIPVIIYNMNSNNNGAVETYPRRMHINFHQIQVRDINLTLDWLSLVTVHESRHIIQNEFYYNIGISRFLTKMLGVRFPLFEVPDWFSEGDAVWKESLLSHGGRGRSPSFSMLFKYMVLEGNSYNYERMVYNSNRIKIPDHYVLGYHIICYLSSKYGEERIHNILKKISSNIFAFTYFDMIIHSEFKKFMSEIYEDMVKEYRQIWNKQIKNLNTIDSLGIYSNKDNDYFYPQYASDGSIIAVKKSMENLLSFVKIENGKEQILFAEPHLEHGNIFSVSKNLITWTSGQMGFISSDSEYLSNIKVYNLETRKTKQLTKKSIYRAPSLSNDSKKIATVKSDFKGNHYLQILDSSTGKIIKTFNNEENAYYVLPSWTKDDKNLLVIKSLNQLNALVSIDILTDKESIIIDYTSDFLNNPKDCGDYIFFDSNYNGINNIYAVAKKNKQIYKITDAKYSSLNPCISENNLSFIYNNFKNGGLAIEKLHIDTKKWKTLDNIKDRRVYLFTTNKLTALNKFQKKIDKNGKIISTDPIAKNPIMTVPNKIYKKKKYSKINKIFNLQSLPIWPLDLETHVGKPAFTIKLKSSSVQKDSKLEADYSKLFLEHKETFNLTFSYTNMVPKFQIILKYEKADFKKLLEEFEETKKQSNATHKELHNKEKIIQLSKEDNDAISLLPRIYIDNRFILNNGYETTIFFSVGSDIKYNFKTCHGEILNFTPCHLTWNVLKIQSKKDIVSRWGTKFEVELQYFLKKANPANTSTFVKLHQYVPGFFKHHSLQLITAMKFRQNSNFWHNKISTFSGFLSAKPVNLTSQLLTRVSRKLMNFHVLYEFPLFFLDIPLSPFAFLKQVNLKLFGSSYLDFEHDQDKKWFQPYLDSVGFIFTFPNIGILRIPKFNISISLGTLYSISKESWAWDFDLHSNLLEEN